MKDDLQKKEREIIDNLEKALVRLKEIPDEKEITTLERDGVIQRFEFVFELTWKAFKALLKKEGIDANSPKSAIGGAYQLKWIENETIWLGIMSDRNITSHVYNEELSKEIFGRIKTYVPYFTAALEKMRQLTDHV